MSINIRPLQHNECEQVSHLFTAILDSSFPMFPEEAKALYKRSWTTDELQQRLAKTSSGILSIAWLQDEAVGLVSGTQPELGVATIIWLLVKPTHQNLRIGSHLLLHAYDHYRTVNCHKVKLTVPSENARRFYLKNGMKEEGYHPNHWANCNFWALACDLT